MKGLTQKELNAKALEVFESNEGLEVVHQTTDGQCFVSEGNAINHQIVLTKDGTRVRTVRASELEMEKANNSANEAGDGGASGKKELKLKELQDMATAAGLPAEEWSGFKSKAEITAYLTEKGVEIK